MPAVLWALLAGNFVIGTGVMVVPGTLNEISASLAVPVATATWVKRCAMQASPAA